MNLDSLLAEGPIRVADHPHLRSALHRGVASGRLARILPGVYVLAAAAYAWHLRARAVALSRPDAVITRRAAAASSWWPELEVGEVTAATRSGASRGVGVVFEKRTIPDDCQLVASGLRITSAALSVLDLIPDLGSSVVDEALRRRAVTLQWLWHTLRATPQRPGNQERAAVLHDSRDQPWSQLEREAHRRLRVARIKGWQTNYRVAVDGQYYFLDVAFPQLGLGVEFDGWSTHSDAESFVRDRARDVLLTKVGWRVIRFTAATLPSMPAELGAIIT